MESVIAYLLGGIAVLVFLAWSRYLSYKERMALLEKGGDWCASVEMGERWRTRWGMLVGAILLAYGLVSFCALLFPRLIVDPSAGERLGDYIWVGFLYGSIGAIVLIAHIVWGRRASAMWARYRSVAAVGESGDKAMKDDSVKREQQG